eukprot:2172659-Pyramimonas_sp.AAC.1
MQPLRTAQGRTGAQLIRPSRSVYNLSKNVQQRYAHAGGRLFSGGRLRTPCAVSCETLRGLERGLCETPDVLLNVLLTGFGETCY